MHEEQILSMRTPVLTFTDTDIGVSAFSNSTVLQAAYQRIQEEIDLSKETIRTWKQRHNTLSIIARLPPEVLSIIFKYVAGAAKLPPYYAYWRMNWIRVSHVSSQWRNVALGCPSLWTIIPFSYPKWAEEMLERSKSAPLTVVVDIPPYNGRETDLITTVLTHMSRIRTLSLCERTGADRRTPMDSIVQSLDSPAPLLESLNLTFSHDGGYVFPKGLFGGQTPRLRELELCCCRVAWDFSLLQGLTTLKLKSIPDGSRPSISQLVEALSNLPNLEVLDLRDVFQVPGSNNTSGDVERIVSHPSLTHLHIEAFATECVSLVNHLAYPPTVLVTLVCTVKVKSSDPHGSLESSLQAIRGLRGVLCKTLPIRCLSARYPYRQGIQLLVSGTSLQDTIDGPQANVTLELDAPPFWYETAEMDMIQTLWGSIPVENLESLHVIQESKFQVIWSNIFDGLAGAKLERLRVVDQSGLKFLRAFSPDAPAPQGREFKRRVPLKFPSLRELTVEGWVFNEAVDDRPCLDRLKTCLKDRRKRRAPIKALFLKNCHVSDQGVGSLQKIVEKVTWV